MTQRKIYLAGPGVFRTDAVAYGQELKAICAAHDFIGLYPFDNEVDLTAPKYEQAITIRRANAKMIRDCDAVIADITPFRGVSLDPGTAWEMGFAEALGKRVVSWSALNTSIYMERVYRQIGAKVVNGRVLADDGNTVEDFGLIDNLQVVAGTHTFASFLEAILFLSHTYRNDASDFIVI